MFRKLLILLLFVGVIIVGFNAYSNNAVSSFYDGFKKGYEEAKKEFPDTPKTGEVKSASQDDESGNETVVVLSHSSNVSGGIFNVSGEVQNNTGINVESVQVIATFYNADNKVIDAAKVLTEIDRLNANQKSPFELSNYPNDGLTSQIDHYELQVDYR